MLRRLKSAKSDSCSGNCTHCVAMNLENDRLRRIIALMNMEMDKLTAQKQSTSVTSTSTQAFASVVDVGCGSKDTCYTTSGTQTQVDFVEVGCGNDEPALNVNGSPTLLHPSNCKEPCSSVEVGCGTEDVNIMVNHNGVNMFVEPFTKLGNQCQSIDINKLDKDTLYTHDFTNRMVAYYGDYSYVYSGGTHQSKPLSDNGYLSEIISSVRKQLPDLAFNSALITKYIDGGHFIPFHSDNESCIVPGSTITTISLGQARVLKFRSSSRHPSRADISVNVSHGDVLFMSQQSQLYFEHSLVKDFSKNRRISITLRLIEPVRPSCDTATQAQIQMQSSGMQANNVPKSVSPPPPTTRSSSESSGSSASSHPIQVPLKSDGATSNGTGSNKLPHKPTTVYISSSMFSKLDEKRLSSEYQDAIVLSYSGANASGILSRLKSDSRFCTTEASTVTKVVLLCGSNNVDSIIRAPKHLREDIVTQGSFDPRDLKHACRDVEELVMFIHNWAPAATINLMNILPRESKARNQIISQLNKCLSKLSESYPYIEKLSTEKDRYLFADRLGFRRSCYFSENGEDNIHLNKKGVVRLANHLKFTAHQ